ncbi:4-hydroxy-3-polyprenylbenzoate decarboxylase [Desulfacinum hydrothermale DSM 13146]|uniref:Flavin prenyltransferase UbiX n=1 Tax=Desulfacinum hydrothermale DSM 13146 TaxID=1121390 RepID=A0A1W1XLG3_9BACT|nr:flavin prenyltransferase UbiX [Desulfacinum hydrothermale]SMC24819.1 4-hydroxy-3-polyprenylbenzoate decarboxylase [Desulfacinum hydrothermale DSM 13146]
MMASKPIVVGVTGASGAPYARRLLQVLADAGLPVHLVASSAGRLVYKLETGRSLEEDLPAGVRLFGEDQFTAPMASGSFQTRGMVIVPCTMATLAAVAQGLANNLIQRAADVCLKERRPLIVVPRETPLNAVHLKNMLTLCQAGALILPPMPGFYHRPETVQDLVDFVVARILDHLGVEHSLGARWQGLE